MQKKWHNLPQPTSNKQQQNKNENKREDNKQQQNETLVSTIATDHVKKNTCFDSCQQLSISPNL